MNAEFFSTEEAKTHQHIGRLFELARDWFFPTGTNPANDKELPREAVFDFGCGDGYYSSQFSTLGIPVYALEGTRNLGSSQLYRAIIQWDLRHPIWLGSRGHVMSVEVAEHVDSNYHEVFMDTLSRHCSGKLLLTWAIRGQGGIRHVSERNEEEVVPFVQQWGFGFSKDKTAEWRRIVGSECGYMKRSIYLFERR